MKILFLEQQPCIRALKYALGLKEYGNYKLTFGYTGRSLTDLYGYGDEYFDRMIRIRLDDDSLLELITSEDFDLIHSHNAPDYLTVRAIEIMSANNIKIPIIHDNHDVISMRQTLYSTHDEYNQKKALDSERIANCFADARINVTQGLADYVIGKYPSKGLTLTFNNYVPRDLIPKNLLPKLSAKDSEIHLVYEGTIDTQRSNGHYDLMEIFTSIAEQKIHIHIYTTRDVPEYVKLAEENKYIHFHGSKPTKELLEEISQYDFGWAGFNDKKNKEHLDVVLANKVMEYIASGLPAITLNHKTQKDFIRETNLGLVVEDINNLRTVIESQDIEKIKELTMAKRYSYTVEANIHYVADFYNQVLSKYNKDSETKSTRYPAFLESLLNARVSLIEIL